MSLEEEVRMEKRITFRAESTETSGAEGMCRSREAALTVILFLFVLELVVLHRPTQAHRAARTFYCFREALQAEIVTTEEKALFFRLQIIIIFFVLLLRSLLGSLCQFRAYQSL